MLTKTHKNVSTFIEFGYDIIPPNYPNRIVELNSVKKNCRIPIISLISGVQIVKTQIQKFLFRIWWIVAGSLSYPQRPKVNASTLAYAWKQLWVKVSSLPNVSSCSERASSCFSVFFQFEDYRRSMLLFCLVPFFLKSLIV